MTEQELREKIKIAIENGFKKADCHKPYTSEPYPYFNSQINAIVNALIEAGIGDVSEWKHRAEVWEQATIDMIYTDGCFGCHARFHGVCPDENLAEEECLQCIYRQAEKELQEER